MIINKQKLVDMFHKKGLRSFVQTGHKNMGVSETEKELFYDGFELSTRIEEAIAPPSTRSLLNLTEIAQRTTCVLLQHCQARFNQIILSRHLSKRLSTMVNNV